MRSAFLLLVALGMATPIGAQLSEFNTAGVAFAHVHLSVADVALEKALWSELLSGDVVEREGYTAVRVPGALVFFTDRAPTAPSVGTAVDHVGFKVRSLAQTLQRWTALGRSVDDEWMGSEGMAQAYVTMPNGTRVELTEDASLSAESEMHHVHFHSPDPDGLRAWYMDLFGASPRVRGTIQTTADVPGANLSFSQADVVTSTAGTAVDHIGFEVEDIAAFADQLRQKGVSFETEPFHVESLDIWVGFFVDPAGTRVEISQGLRTF